MIDTIMYQNINLSSLVTLYVFDLNPYNSEGERHVFWDMAPHSLIKKNSYHIFRHHIILFL